MAKKIMRSFKMNEISGVDKPAQKGALALIAKRDAGTGDLDLYLAKAAGATDLPAAVEAYLKRTFTADQRKEDAASGAAMPDGSFPIKDRTDLENAIRAHGRAKDPAKAKSHITARARSLDATSLLPAEWKAGKSIGGDLVMEIMRVAPRALPDLLENVTKAEEIEDEIAKLADPKIRKQKQHGLRVAKAALISSAWSIADSTSGEDKPSLLRKTFSEYKDHIVGLAPHGAEHGDADMQKVIAKSLGLAETATEAEVQKALDAQAVLAKRADAILKMSGKHSAFMANEKAKMPEGGKEAFADMSADQRDKHMEKNPIEKAAKEKDEDEDEDDSDGAQKNCIKVDGVKVLRKSVGDSMFSVVKSQQAAIQKAERETAIGVIEKRVSPLKLLIGKADETAAILYRVSIGKATKADADAIEKVLVSANTLIGKSDVLLKEIGGNGGNGGFSKAIEGINAAANVLMQKDAKLTLAKARVMARDQNPELAKQEEIEAREARRAA